LATMFQMNPSLPPAVRNRTRAGNNVSLFKVEKSENNDCRGLVRVW
jgi:hypothetical protein